MGGTSRDAVLPAPGLGLVQPERRKGDDVDGDERGGDVGGGEEKPVFQVGDLKFCLEVVSSTCASQR